MYQSCIILWNQCTYELYNSPKKYYFDLQSLETSLQFQQKDYEVSHLIIICTWNFTYAKENHKKQFPPSKFSIFLKIMEFR